MREKISRIINGAKDLNTYEKIYSEIYFMITILLIFLTPVMLYVEFVQTALFANNFDLFRYLHYIILTFFSLDLLARLFISNNRKNYLTSIDGIVDILAVLPDLIVLFLGLGGSTTWLRVIKLFRLKTGHVLKGRGLLSGFTRTMVLTSTGVVSIKILILILEAYNLIPVFKNISVVLGLVIFALAMLLGTKLSVVNKRLYNLEDSITSIIAGVKVFWFTNQDTRPHLIKWINCFYDHLKNPSSQSASKMREENNRLYEIIGNLGINPNFTTFSRDASFILNKSVSEVNPNYERFLFLITVVLTIVILFTIPGITGMVASFIVSFIFFGLYHLVADMDKPLDYGDDSLISVDLTALEELIDDFQSQDSIN